MHESLICATAASSASTCGHRRTRLFSIRLGAGGGTGAASGLLGLITSVTHPNLCRTFQNFSSASVASLSRT